MKSRHLSLSALLAGLALVAPVHAASVTVFDDTFTDGDRTNGTDANDVPWYAVGVATLSVATDATLGGGNALVVTPSGTFNRIAAEFGAVTLDVGYTLELTFDIRYTSTPANTGGAYRFGIYNNGGSAFTADGQTGGNENNNFGYGFSTNAGAASSTGTRVATEAAGSAMLSGSSPSGFVVTGTGGDSYNLGGTAHSMLFSITRLANGTLDLLAQIDNGVAATGNVSPLVAGNYTFHEVAFGGSLNESFNIDNVKLAVVPEPTAALLGGLGLLTLLRRRR